MSSICSKCGRECKDQRGLTIHENKCGLEKNTTCIHCHVMFSSYDNLNRHLLVCKVLKQQNEEKERKRISDEYNEQIKSLIIEHQSSLKNQEADFNKRYNDALSSFKAQEIESSRRHDTMINMCKEDQRILSIEKETLRHKIKELEDTVKEQKGKIKELEKKNDTFSHNMIEFAKKATDKTGTTIYQNQCTSVQTNLQLQHFDASLLRDKIVPPNHMIYNVGQLVEHVHRFGIGNMYRSVDRSRNTIIWVNQDGSEIRDSNCSQFREQILEAIDGDLKRQLLYQQERAEKLEKIEGSDHIDELISVRRNIVFCRNLLERNGKVMKELQKEISKKGKNKSDTTMDVPRLVGYTTFHTCIEDLLLQTFYEWIGLSFDAFGRWLSIKLVDQIETEGSVLYQETKFIVIKNDEGQPYMMYTKEFGQLVQQIYTENISVKARQILTQCINSHLEKESCNSIAMLKWLETPDEQMTSIILTGIISQRLGR